MHFCLCAPECEQWFPFIIRSQLEPGRAIRAEPKELRAKIPSNTGFPLIDRALPQVAQLVIAGGIEAMSYHGFPSNDWATPGLVR
jgi:hypothetical protein